MITAGTPLVLTGGRQLLFLFCKAPVNVTIFSPNGGVVDKFAGVREGMSLKFPAEFGRVHIESEVDQPVSIAVANGNVDYNWPYDPSVFTAKGNVFGHGANLNAVASQYNKHLLWNPTTDKNLSCFFVGVYSTAYVGYLLKIIDDKTGYNLSTHLPGNYLGGGDAAEAEVYTLQDTNAPIYSGHLGFCTVQTEYFNKNLLPEGLPVIIPPSMGLQFLTTGNNIKTVCQFKWKEMSA